MNIRQAVVGDEHSIARLIYENIEPELRKLTIWNSPRIAEYIKECIEGPRDNVFYVAELADRSPVGIVQYRALDDVAFVNHIFVDPQHRGAGLGSRLLFEASSLFMNIHEIDTISLDTAENTPARNWYESLGFRMAGNVLWQTAPLSASSESQGAVVLQRGTLKSMERFDFCQLIVDTGHDRHTIGQLGTRYFYVHHTASWRDPVLHETLKSICPKAKLILRCEGRLPGAQVAYRSVRMTTDRRALLKKLSERLSPAATR